MFYVNSKTPTFVDLLNMTEEPFGHSAGIGREAGQGSAGTGHGGVAVVVMYYVFLQYR